MCDVDVDLDQRLPITAGGEPAVWPVILWVAFQLKARYSLPKLKDIHALVAIIESQGETHIGVWQWDDTDEKMLRETFISQDGAIASWIDRYPHAWREYICLLNSRDWVRLKALTHQPSRPRFAPTEYDTGIRVGALLLWTSTNSNSKFQQTDTILTLDRFVTDMVECMDNHVSRALPQRFISYVFACLLLKHGLVEGDKEDDFELCQLRDLAKGWAQWDVLTSLANYHSVVNILFGYLKTSSQSGRHIASQISAHLSQDVSGVLRQFVSVLSNSETYKDFLAYRGAPAQQLLDLIQDLLDSTSDSTSRRLLSKALMRLSRESGLHPTCFALSGLEKVGQQVAAGGYGDVWKGLVQGQDVSVKVVRLFRDSDVKSAVKEFGREALIWRQLSHPNLLPFFGLYYLDGRLCLVSPWMDNGDLVQFLKDAPLDTNSTSLILDIALGLEYLHTEHIIHGDLKGTNILVTPSRRACIADFGSSSIISSMTMCFTHSTAASQRGTMRWQAPELLRGDNVNHLGSDIYAFACVCYEILSGNLPFYELLEPAVMYQVTMKGLRPARPVPWGESKEHDGLWQLMEECWKEEWDTRPTAAEIIQRLIHSPIGAKPTRLEMDWGHTSSSRFRPSLHDCPLLPSITQIEKIISTGSASIP
ncbi:kinase-like domain-containing protein [Mycena leptocephala]|nr:kinase-like domain-containing protein [Mycena leptocephala]